VAFDFLEFKELFIIHSLKIGMLLHFHLIAFIDLHYLFNDVNLFDGELDTTKLDDISTLHDIFYLVILVLEASNY
jgi:hypothetical protein